MDILVKFVSYAKEESSGLENKFNSKKEVQEYFLNLDNKNGNNNFFFLIRKKRFDEKGTTSNIVNNDDNIYFVFKGEIIAKAKFSYSLNTEKERKFKNGYKVRNVLLLASPFSLGELTKNPYTPGSRHSVYFIKKEDELLKKELNEIFQ